MTIYPSNTGKSVTVQDVIVGFNSGGAENVSVSNSLRLLSCKHPPLHVSSAFVSCSGQFCPVGHTCRKHVNHKAERAEILDFLRNEHTFGFVDSYDLNKNKTVSQIPFLFVLQDTFRIEITDVRLILLNK